MKSILTFTLSCILLLGTAGITSAQTLDAPDTWPQETETWTQLFDHQMAQLLADANPDVREEAMLHVIHHARYVDASGTPLFSFDETLPKLLSTIQTDTDREHRLLALAALDAIGNDMALTQLHRSLPDVESEDVQRRALHVISAHRE